MCWPAARGRKRIEGVRGKERVLRRRKEKEVPVEVRTPLSFPLARLDTAMRLICVADSLRPLAHVRRTRRAVAGGHPSGVDEGVCGT